MTFMRIIVALSLAAFTLATPVPLGNTNFCMGPYALLQFLIDLQEVKILSPRLARRFPRFPVTREGMVYFTIDT